MKNKIKILLEQIENTFGSNIDKVTNERIKDFKTTLIYIDQLDKKISKLKKQNVSRDDIELRNLMRARASTLVDDYTVDEINELISNNMEKLSSLLEDIIYLEKLKELRK